MVGGLYGLDGWHPHLFVAIGYRRQERQEVQYKVHYIVFIVFKYSWWIGVRLGKVLEAEAGGEVKVVVAVEEAVNLTLIPMALVVEVEGIEEVAGGAHECHLGRQIGREQ